MRAKPVRAKRETPKHRSSRCLHSRLMAFFPLTTSYKQPSYVSLVLAHEYREERTTEPLQKLSRDVPLNRSEPECTFMHRKSQGVGLIGKVAAYICASRSKHRLALLYNLASQIKNTVSDFRWQRMILFSTALSFCSLISLQSIGVDIYESIVCFL